MRPTPIFIAGVFTGAGLLFAVALAYYLFHKQPVAPGLAPGTPPVVIAPPASKPLPPPPAEATQPPPADTPAAPAAEAPPPSTPAAPPAAPVPGSATPQRSGALLMPVPGVQPDRLVDTYNQARGTERRHEALDIPAPRGTSVVAVDDGKVAKLFNSKPGGLTVYQFDTAEKLAYYYAHLDGYAPGLNEGQQLKRGDLVGYVGTTGNANPDAPHLHFAVFQLGPEKRWWQGTPINPYPLLTAH